MRRQLLKVLCYGAFFLLVASGALSPQTAEAKEQAPLAWTEWELTSPVYEGLEKKPFLKFTDTRMHASVGLNSLGGSYETKDERIQFSHMLSTQMAGPAPVMDAEFRYSRALEGARNFTVSNDGETLVLRGQQTLEFRFTGRSAEAKAPNPLAWTEWELTSPAYQDLEETPFLKFTDTRMSASVGLNQLGSPYRTEGERIFLEPLISTRMAGPPPLMQAEEQYKKALQDTMGFRLSADGEILTLRGRNQALVFRLTGKSRADSNPSTQKNLAWTEWELSSPSYQGLEKAPFLKFTDTRINASVGLNSMNGVYRISGEKIEIDALASTRMAGPAPLMAAESEYSKALQEARSFTLSADGSSLTLRGGQPLIFRFVGATAQDFVATETKIINVSSRLGPELDGDQRAKYLQLEDLSEGGGWGRFTEAEIIGFDFVPGYRYQLRVQVERNRRSGEKRLRLLEVFTQQWMRAAQIGRNDKILEVAPTKVDCTGVGDQQCLQVREVGGEWQNFYAPIEGFEFEEGWRYRLQVAVMPVENPPADGSSLRYVLVRLLDKMPVIY